MTYNLFLSRAAISDLEQAVEWNDEQRIGLGFEFELSIEASLTYLQRNPLKFQKKYQDIRVKYIKRFPYGIHYEIEELNIKIIAIFHMKRDPHKWNEQLRKKDFD